MKKPIEKRLNIALDAEDWQTLVEYMEAEKVNQTGAIRQFLKEWRRKQEAMKNTRGFAHPEPYITHSEKEGNSQ